MKIYYKPTDQDPKDRLLEDLIKEENLTLDNPSEDWLDRMLKESKVEYDETWMAEAESQMPEGMEERLLATINRLEAETQQEVKMVTPVIQMTPEKQSQPPQIGMKLWKRVAACFVVILAIGIGYNLQGSNNAFADTCKTPEEAQMQLERALTLLSKNGKAIDKADETLQQATQPHEDILSKFITIQ